MTELKIGMVGVVVVARRGHTLVIQRQAQSRLQGEVQALRLKSEELDSVLAENARLSNIVAQTESANPLGEAQLSELMRLRGEVRATPSASQRSEETAGRKPPAPNRSDRAAGGKRCGRLQCGSFNLNIQLPKDTWAFTGYGTPEAALQTMMWARREGDSKSAPGEPDSPGFMDRAQKAWGDKV